jgi:formyltetrahydrofolate deformylase
MKQAGFILTLKCPDKVGIVAQVTATIASLGANILESAQFGDELSGTYFMRVAFMPPPDLTLVSFKDKFAPIAHHFAMEWGAYDANIPMRVMILASKQDHCLVDLLYRNRQGALKMDITSIGSNHAETKRHADQAGLVFHHLPISKETKLEQETHIVKLFREEKVDLVILARYMQILSDGLTAKLAGRCINIHHSFLPSFKGAAPYTQAHSRGVKLIGATAHYVTAALDEGPIIEQATERVDHAMSVDEFVSIGREIEARVLARAVKYHLEHRVITNGNKTVVFK